VQSGTVESRWHETRGLPGPRRRRGPAPAGRTSNHLAPLPPRYRHPHPRPHHPPSSPSPGRSPLPTSTRPSLPSCPSEHPSQPNTQCAFPVGHKFVGTKSGGAAWVKPTQSKPRVRGAEGEDRQSNAAGAVERSKCRPAVVFRPGARHRAGTAPGKHGGWIANGLRTFELSLAPSRSRSRPFAWLRSRSPPSPGPPKTGRLSFRRLRLGWHRDASIDGTCRPSLLPCDASSQSGTERSSNPAKGLRNRRPRSSKLHRPHASRTRPGSGRGISRVY